MIIAGTHKNNNNNNSNNKNKRICEYNRNDNFFVDY